MKKIFISYRRQDTRTIAGRIVDHLEARYGRDAVLIDIESIPPGVDFQDWLQDQIASASIVIALIGPGWTNARDERGKRRLDSSGDFVRMELEAAIARKIPLIPLLIDGALTPPARELPASLRPLTRRNAAFLDPGRDFNSHITRLIGAIDRHLNEDESATPALGTKAGSSSAIMVSAKPALYEDPAECLIRTFIGHAGEVYSVAISPDGRFALSGAQDGSLKLWDMNSGREIKSFWGHKGSVNSVSMSPDGSHALSGSQDKTLKLWDLATGHHPCSFPLSHEKLITSVAISSNGQFAVSASADRNLITWELENGEAICRFVGHQHPISSVAISPNGEFLLSGSRVHFGEPEIKLWNVADGKERNSLTGHSDSVHSVAVAASGLLAITGSKDATIKLWDIRQARKIKTFAGHKAAVNAVAFSSNGKYVLSGGSDKLLILWEASSGRQVRWFRGHMNAVRSVSFSSDNRFALSGSADQTLKLWDISSCTETE